MVFILQAARKFVVCINPLALRRFDIVKSRERHRICFYTILIEPIRIMTNVFLEGEHSTHCFLMECSIFYTCGSFCAFLTVITTKSETGQMLYSNLVWTLGSPKLDLWGAYAGGKPRFIYRLPLLRWVSSPTRRTDNNRPTVLQRGRRPGGQARELGRRCARCRKDYRSRDTLSPRAHAPRVCFLALSIGLPLVGFFVPLARTCCAFAFPRRR